MITNGYFAAHATSQCHKCEKAYIPVRLARVHPSHLSSVIYISRVYTCGLCLINVSALHTLSAACFASTLEIIFSLRRRSGVMPLSGCNSALLH